MEFLGNENSVCHDRVDTDGKRDVQYRDIKNNVNVPYAVDMRNSSVPYAADVRNNSVPHADDVRSNSVSYADVRNNSVPHADDGRSNSVPYADVRNNSVPHAADVRNHSVPHADDVRNNSVTHSAVIRSNSVPYSADVRNNSVSYAADVRTSSAPYADDDRNSSVPHSADARNNSVPYAADTDIKNNVSAPCAPDGKSSGPYLPEDKNNVHPYGGAAGPDIKNSTPYTPQGPGLQVNSSYFIPEPGTSLPMPKKSYTMDEKLRVIRRAEQIGNRPAAKECNINESLIRTWRKRKGELETPQNPSPPPRTRSKRRKVGRFPQLERELREWMKCHQLDKNLTRTKIRAQAERIAGRYHIQNFKASNGWLENFLKRAKSARAEESDSDGSFEGGPIYNENIYNDEEFGDSHNGDENEDGDNEVDDNDGSYFEDENGDSYNEEDIDEIDVKPNIADLLSLSGPEDEGTSANIDDFAVPMSMQEKEQEREQGGVKKRKSYANSFKLEAIKLGEKLGNRPAAKKLGLDESHIREWRKRKTEIAAMPSYRRSKRNKKPKWAELEKQLAQWYMNRKSRNLYLTINMVKEKGVELATQFGYTDFSGSSGWVSRFMCRLKESNGTMIQPSTSPSKPHKQKTLANSCDSTFMNDYGPQSALQTPQIPPEHIDKAQSFRSFFSDKKAQNELKRRNGIICIDEIPMSLDMPLDNGNNGQNSTTSYLSGIPPSEKFQFTIVLSCSAAGGKIPPLVIFKGLMPAIDPSAFPEGLIVRSNDKGWINSYLIEDWIENCWKRWLWPARSEDNILILDSCKTHRAQDMKFKMSKYFQTSFIPQGVSKFLHPLELSINKFVRNSVIRKWENWILEQSCGGPDGNEEEEYCKKIENYIVICDWVLEAWNQVNSQTIMTGFARTGIESFSPEEVVAAILSENGGDVCDQEPPLLQDHMLVFSNADNYIGDEFDGWE